MSNIFFCKVIRVCMMICVNNLPFAARRNYGSSGNFRGGPKIVGWKFFSCPRIKKINWVLRGPENKKQFFYLLLFSGQRQIIYRNPHLLPLFFSPLFFVFSILCFHAYFSKFMEFLDFMDVMDPRLPCYMQ